MSIESRITKLEAAANNPPSVDGVALRAELHRLLTEEPEKVEALRMAAMERDTDPALRSLLDPRADRCWESS